MKYVIQRFLNTSAQDGMKVWLQAWSKDQLKLLVNQMNAFDTDEKDSENEMTQILQGVINYYTTSAITDDSGYRTMKNAIMLWYGSICTVIQCTMPDKWETLSNTSDCRYDTLLFTCMKKIFDKSCLKDYEPTKDQPSKPMMELTITHIMRIIKKQVLTESGLKKDKENKDQPTWKTKIHFPGLIGMEVLLFVMNHYQLKKHLADDTLIVIGAPSNSTCSNISVIINNIMDKIH